MAEARSDRLAQLSFAAHAIGMSYTEFISQKTDFARAGCRKGNNYVHTGRPVIGCTKPAPLNAFNWNDDGCSGAEEAWGAGRPVSLLYRDLFNQACQQHDFGYRNFGEGLKLSRTESTRRQIDDRFLGEMRRTCDTRFPGWVNTDPRLKCNTIANGMYGVVRNFNDWSRG